LSLWLYMKGLLRAVLHCCVSAPVEESAEEESVDREVPVLPPVQPLQLVEGHWVDLRKSGLKDTSVEPLANKVKAGLPRISIVPPGQSIRTVLFAGSAEPEDGRKPRGKKKRKTDKGARKQPSQT